MRRTLGGEVVSAFVPEPLPPMNPPLAIDGPTSELLHRAEDSLRRLDLAGDLIPSLEWFVYAFVRKEAVVSSQIEGTQATLIDLLTFEATREPVDRAPPHVDEICRYLAALSFARHELSSPRGLPLSIRLLNEAHRRLMRGVRGGERQPGEIRRSQNWIGGTRPGNAVFVPPPPEEVPALLGALERYIHGRDELHPLIRIALAHVQFETIHPYLDGNGRVGRLLITLLLEHWSLLSAPLLYLSLYLKRHRAEYYRLLNEVRERGDWEGWVTFFLEGVATIADEAILTARALFRIAEEHRTKVLSAKGSTVMSLRLLEQLPARPIVTIPTVAEMLGTTKPTASKAIAVLERLGIVTERTGRRRDRVFGYKAYLERLRTGTELDTA